MSTKSIDMLLPKAKLFITTLAKSQAFVYYKRLYDYLGLDTNNPGDRNIGAELLASLSDESYKNDKILISSLVVLKLDNEPANGFYELSINMGLLHKKSTKIQRELFWINCVKAVFNKYNK